MAKAPDDLFPDARNPPDTHVLNARCVVRTQEAHRVVMVSGMVLAQYAVSDRMSEAHAMVSLVDQGWASQREVAQAFGYSARTVRRQERRFEDGGLPALGRTDGYSRGRPRLAASRRRGVQQLKAQGLSQREIARRLGVSEKAVRKLLRRLGWQATPATQAELPLPHSSPAAPKGPVSSADPNLSAFSAATPKCPPRSLDTDPADRRGDRLMARLGLLWTMRPRCLARARPSRRPGFSWPCRRWCAAGSSTVPRRSTAVWGPRSSACAPRC